MSYTPVQVFNEVNGFSLKPPSQYKDNSNKFTFIDRREDESRNNNQNLPTKEFIEITKEKNKLPTVTLRSYVLYYRNNGNQMTTSFPNNGSQGEAVNYAENYRFYNDLSVLKTGQTWTISNWAQYMTVNAAYNKFADSTSGNGIITYGGTGQGAGGTKFFTARFDIVKSGLDIIITSDRKGENFVAGDTITFKAANHTSWLTAGADFTFTVTSGQIDESAIGRQLGWIFGFPLFDVSGGSGSWPRFESCYSNDANDISGNQKMLVNISNKRNIITLDMSKFQFKDQYGTEKGDGYDDIKFWFTQNSNLSYRNFYMNLRITGSSENSISYPGTLGMVRLNGTSQASYIYVGKDGNWPPCIEQDSVTGGTINRFSNKWCTLVEYEFYCDLINPKPFLDFTPNYFSFDYTDGVENGRRFIQTENKEDYISNDFESSNVNINTYIESITLKIRTGLGRDAAANGLGNNMIETMSPGNIIKGLTLRDDPNNIGYANRLKEKTAWNRHSSRESWTLAKIIGGWYSRGESGNSTTRDIGYYGSIVSTTPNNRQTKYDQTVSWKNDVELVNSPWIDNVWPALDNGSKSFTLRNILWCSLRSPRKIKVNYIGNNAGTGTATVLVGRHRFITNFIDLKNSLNGSNEILGGGYARNPNELDLPRKSEKPYFSKYEYQSDISQINSNTVGILQYDMDNDTQYLDASRNNNGNTLSLNDINYYKIQYKLLIPPGVYNAAYTSYKIKYSFGKTNNCVTTFFRFEDMSGTPDPFPDGSNNHYAVRDSESIELVWEYKETDIKTIYITDIASGTNNVVSTIESQGHLRDASYNAHYNDFDPNVDEMTDLSFNVFQLLFFSRNTIDETNTIRNELPYTIYTFDTTSDDAKVVDISYTPVNYVPYRYMNYYKKGFIESETVFFPGSGHANEPSGPIYTREEQIIYNPGKIFPRGIPNGADRTTAVVIDPSNTDVFPTVFIDISGDIIYDNSFSIVPNQLSQEDAQLPINQGQEIATFDQQISNINQIIFDNSFNLFQLQGVGKDEVGNDIGLYFDEPSQLMLKNYLIPDYWRLSNKLNILRTINDTGSSNDNYRYYDNWENQIKTSMIFDILNIELKSTGAPVDGARVSNILVNTNTKAIGSNEYSAITTTGRLLNNSTNNLVYEVQGALGVPPTDYLNLEPIIVLLKAPFDGPFGTIGQNFIGNKATAQGGINVPYPAQPGIPENDSKFIVNTALLDTLRRGNNIDGSDLGGASSAYNGIFNIDTEVPNKEDYGLLKQNNSFIGTIIGPSPLPVLLVDLSSAVQLNPLQFDMLNDENNKVTIDWSGFSFSNDPDWETSHSDIYWSVSRLNLSTGFQTTLLQDTQIKFLNNKYTFIDTSVVVFTKYRYTITGKFKWTGITNYINTTEIPFLNVIGFSTSDILICKYNRFPYGRFNTTSTNLKLYAPLRLTTPQGQVDQFNKKTAGGGCTDPNNPSLNLFTRSSRISSSNNIYANTTDQVSQKQTYVILSKSRFRPFR